MSPVRLCQLLLLPAVLLMAAGCQSRPISASSRMFVPTHGLAEPTAVETVQAVCVPPAGWMPEQLKSSSRHTHQVWLSPTGSTAYGVIRMRLPFPVGPDLVLWGFMMEMRREEGEGRVLEKEEDPYLPGLRFIAEGGQHVVRTNLITSGRTAWAIYAGTLRDQPIDADELDLAERARENTTPGLP